MSLAAPATNPASDLELKLPSTIGSANQLLKNSGTAGTLEFSNGLTYDGTDLTLGAGRAKLTDESSGAQLRIGAAGDFQIEHDASNTYLANTTGDLVFQNDANVKITAKTGGTQRFRFDSDGLKFGTDTAAANALDNYEEGVFTATCSNSVTLHSGHQDLAYTRIGRLVTIMGQVRVNSSNSGATFVINNLPFVCANTSEYSDLSIGATRLYEWNMPSGGYSVVCISNATTSHMEFWNNKDDVAASAVAADGNGYIAVTLNYITT